MTERFVKCSVTRYVTGTDAMVDVTTFENASVYIEQEPDRTVLSLGNCGASMDVKTLREIDARGEGWYADAGTRPVYMEPCKHPEEAPTCCGRTCQVRNGGWGGRNYPQVFISAEDLHELIEAIS